MNVTFCQKQVWFRLGNKFYKVWMNEISAEGSEFCSSDRPMSHELVNDAIACRHAASEQF